MSAARADETNKRTNDRCSREPGESDARVMFGGGGGGGGDGTNPFGRPTPTPTPGGANPFAASANGGGDGNGNLVGTPFGRATTTPASPFGQPSTSATPFGRASTSASTPFGQPSTSTPFGSTSFGAFGGGDASAGASCDLEFMKMVRDDADKPTTGYALQVAILGRASWRLLCCSWRLI